MQEKRVSHEEIARVAYLLWEEEGRPQGRDKEHWRKAEAALQKKLAAKPGPTSKKRKKPSHKKSAGGAIIGKKSGLFKSRSQKIWFSKGAAPKKSRQKTGRAFAQKGKRKPPRTSRTRKSSSPD